jgi:hypothetical protein
MKITTLFIAFLLFGILSSCRIIYRTVLGVDTTPGWPKHKKIEKITKKRGIPREQAFVMDTASYLPFVINDSKAKWEEYKADKDVLTKEDSLVLKRINNERKDNTQPVQVRYFNQNGEPIFKMVNCYVDPPIPMRWNVQGSLDVFPPVPIKELKDQEDVNMQTLLPFIKNMDGQPITFSELPKSKYYAVVFWNSFMIRPSKRLISQIMTYNHEIGKDAAYILFVNNHKSQIWKMAKPKSKELIKKVGY